MSVTAIGYPGDPDELPEELAERAAGPREREPLAELASREADRPPW